MPEPSIDFIDSIKHHPCFSADASRTVGRLHLPVAPKCNVQCRFCNRKYHCVAESRPGVTGSVLTPEKAQARVEFVLECQPEIAVVGIAGPGDPMANPEETLKTFKLVKAAHPELQLCMSTNGLMLDRYLPELQEAGLSHITITINSFSAEIVEQMYEWVQYDGKKYKGRQAAELLIDCQRKALDALLDCTIPCKINIVLIPGINDNDIEKLVGELSSYKAVTCVNIMPFIPVEGSAFEARVEPTAEMLRSIRTAVEPLIPQIRHCCQCRSDAVGLLSCTRAGQSLELMQAINTFERRAHDIIDGLKPGVKIAVAGSDRTEVKEHFGHAAIFQVYQFTEKGFQFFENRVVKPLCVSETEADDPLENMALIIKTLADCSAIICTRIGPNPRAALESAGFHIVEKSGKIDSILKDFE
jgi:nitrogenase cofactor biosynthesis protein NifB